MAQWSQDSALQLSQQHDSGQTPGSTPVKKAWMTPAAEVVDVAEVTKNSAGAIAKIDGPSCSS